MSGLTQGADTGGRLALSLFQKTAILVVLTGCIQGCGIGAQSIAALSPEGKLTTASVAPGAATLPDGSLAADSRAILAALAAYDQPAGMTALPWENPQSGARGLITAYSGGGEVERNCLSFTTTRESFDGIGLYDGKACKDSAGILRLRGLSML